MGAGVVTVGRRSYAVGLYWENSPSGRVAQAAREAASQPGQKAEFYAVRTGTKEGRVPQFGLGQALAGHKPGMASFAGCLANQQPGSWVGAFRLREGTVICVVRDELIVPDGDQLFINEADARDRLLQEIGFGGLQKVYAPESWAIAGADTMPISLLMDERKDVTLHTVQIPKKMILFGTLGVTLLLIAVGAAWYIQQEAEHERQSQLEREEALKRIRDMASKLPGAQNQQPEYPPPKRVWEDRPLPLEVIEACRTGLTKVTAAVAGWKMGTLKCDGQKIETTWSRMTGMSASPPGTSVDPEATHGTLNVPLPKLIARGHQDLANPDDITKRYLAQDWPGSIARAPDDPPPPPPAGYQGPWNPPPPPWVKRSFTFTVPELPSSVPLFIGDLPGTIINSLTYSPGTVGGSWVIEGVIYENRI